MRISDSLRVRMEGSIARTRTEQEAQPRAARTIRAIRELEPIRATFKETRSISMTPGVFGRDPIRRHLGTSTQAGVGAAGALIGICSKSMHLGVIPQLYPADAGRSRSMIRLLRQDDPCPLVAIFGNFTNDPNSPTPVHDSFAPNVAVLIDDALADLNSMGIVPEIEDGFRTTQEQADRKKKYPIAAKLSWHQNRSGNRLQQTRSQLQDHRRGDDLVWVQRWPIF